MASNFRFDTDKPNILFQFRWIFFCQILWCQHNATNVRRRTCVMGLIWTLLHYYIMDIFIVLTENVAQNSVEKHIYNNYDKQNNKKEYDWNWHVIWPTIRCFLIFINAPYSNSSSSGSAHTQIVWHNGHAPCHTTKQIHFDWYHCGWRQIVLFKIERKSNGMLLFCLLVHRSE